MTKYVAILPNIKRLKTRKKNLCNKMDVENFQFNVHYFKGCIVLHYIQGKGKTRKLLGRIKLEMNFLGYRFLIHLLNIQILMTFDNILFLSSSHLILY